jgi:hypothetical protein
LPGRAPGTHRNGARPERYVLQLPSQRVVRCERCELLLKPENEEDTGIGTQRYRRVTVLDFVQGEARDPGTFSHHLHGQPPAAASETNVLAETRGRLR